ncbi:unnamed protein product, partial [Polarella glacialis]
VSTNFTVICKDLRLTMQGCPAPGRMAVSNTLTEDANVINVPYSQQGTWTSPFTTAFETTLGDLLKVPASSGAASGCEHLAFVVIDEMGVRQGEARLEFRKAFTTKPDEPVAFKVPVNYCSDEVEESRQVVGAVGELEGVVIYRNIPVYAQMAGGSIVDAEIQGGCILVDGLPYPPCMPQPPPVWQDGGGMEAFSMDPDGGEDQEIDFNDIADKWVFE